MNVPLRKVGICLAMGVLSSFVSIGADESAAPSSAASNGVDDAASLFRRFQEVTGKVRRDPTLIELKEAAEVAQRKYTDAYEAAIDLEAPELLNKIRLLQQQRLSSARERLKNSSSESKLSAEDLRRYQSVREKAAQQPEVLAAEKRQNDASDASERAKMRSEYNRLLDEAMLAIDPEITPILKKRADLE